MKRLLILYSLLISVLAQAGGNALLVLQYRLNKAYITEQFCENKQRPELGCEGSCHLKKQLENLDDTQRPTPTSLKLAANMVWICQELPQLLPNPQAISPGGGHTHYNRRYTPPCAACPEQPPRLQQLG